MLRKVVAIVVLLALLITPTLAFALQETPTPAEEGTVEQTERPPTEYFAYGAVGLLLLLLLFIGFGYIRTTMRAAEPE